MGALAKSAPAQEYNEDDLAAMKVEGEIVLVDTADWKLDGKTPAVVMRFDGTLGIELARHSKNVTFGGSRTGLYNFNKNPPWGVWHAHSCMILGRVIGRE